MLTGSDSFLHRNTWLQRGEPLCPTERRGPSLCSAPPREPGAQPVPLSHPLRGPSTAHSGLFENGWFLLRTDIGQCTQLPSCDMQQTLCHRRGKALERFTGEASRSGIFSTPLQESKPRTSRRNVRRERRSRVSRARPQLGPEASTEVSVLVSRLLGMLAIS